MLHYYFKHITVSHLFISFGIKYIEYWFKDIVGRKSYGKDILFIVTKIIKTRNGDSISILKGLTIRIEADSPVSDLERANAIVVHNNLRTLDSKLQNRIHQCSPISTPCMASLKNAFPRE